jgi:hypothetical protein
VAIEEGRGTEKDRKGGSTGERGRKRERKYTRRRIIGRKSDNERGKRKGVPDWQ